MSDPFQYPPCVAEKLAELERERDLIIGSVPSVKIAESIADMFRDLCTNVALPNAGRVCHYITIKSSMDEAVAVLREYRKLGIKVEGHHDHGEARIYKLSRDIDVYVSIPQHEGARCRYVQVGVKEVPVMELQCNGKTVASEVAP